MMTDAHPTKAGLKVRRIVCDSIPDDFDPAVDLVPGPWVLAQQEAAWPDWENHNFFIPVKTVEEIADADRLTGEIAETLTALFAERLAARHGSDRSPEFWYLLLIRWVLETVQMAWMRYQEAEHLLWMAQRDSLSLMAPAAETVWRFTSISDMYQRGICDRRYNAWLLGLALEATSENPVIRLASPADQQDIRSDNGRTYTLLQRAYLAVKQGRCEIGNMGSEYNLRTKLLSAAVHTALNLWLEVIPRRKEIHSHRANFDPALRAKVGEKLYDYLVRVLEQSLLLPFGDDFAAHDAAARKVRARKGRLSIKTISYQMSASRLFEAAHRIDQGEGLVHLQHGCNYGTARAYNLGSMIEYNQHAFLTWGWHRHGSYPGRFKSFPAPQLAPWLNSHRRDGNAIILVSSIIPFLPSRLISSGELHCHDRRADRAGFFRSLSPDLSADLLYRPYPQLDYAAKDAGYFQAEFPDIRQISSQLDFFRASRSCRMMVIDHPGLTFYQALISGTPAICFWTDLHWPIDPGVKPMFDELRRVGILFDTGREAAEALNQRGPAFEDWWQGEEVQAAISAIREYDAQTSRFWLPVWMKKVLSL
tara:strand:+ start:1253 stop:3025 length:1773 start_codon:yes stop_codon:yes gene_type:complete